jgi:hypothetical protein
MLHIIENGLNSKKTLPSANIFGSKQFIITSMKLTEKFETFSLVLPSIKWEQFGVPEMGDSGEDVCSVGNHIFIDFILQFQLEHL